MTLRLSDRRACGGHFPVIAPVCPAFGTLLPPGQERPRALRLRLRPLAQQTWPKRPFDQDKQIYRFNRQSRELMPVAAECNSVRTGSGFRSIATIHSPYVLIIHILCFIVCRYKPGRSAPCRRVAGGLILLELPLPFPLHLWKGSTVPIICVSLLAVHGATPHNARTDRPIPGFLFSFAD